MPKWSRMYDQSLHRSRISAIFLYAIILHASASARSQDSERLNVDASIRIRDAALNHSEIMDMVGYLTDVVGPRLTGSPNLKRAEEYARDKLHEWGLANAHLEAWGPFGRGWSLEGFSANVLSPGFAPLIGYPKAWSPGTSGTIRGEAVFLDVRTAADLDKHKGKLKGRIVLFSPARHVDPLFDPPAERQSDAELLRLANSPPTGPRQPFRFTPEQRAAEELNYRKWQLVGNEGAAVVLQPSASDAGTVYVTSATVPYPPDVPFAKRVGAWDLGKSVVTPQANVAVEQYNRVVRLLARGIRVELEVNILGTFLRRRSDELQRNRRNPRHGFEGRGRHGGRMHRLLARGHRGHRQRRGCRLRARSHAPFAGPWTEASTDRAHWALEWRRAGKPWLARLCRRAPWTRARRVGCSNGALAIRIQARVREVRRLFQFRLWYGPLRGVFLQGNETARPIFRALLEPLRDLGASTLSIGDMGGDHASFADIGLPGFQWIRDYMEGNKTRAAHTNMDTYDHVIEEDLKQSAAVATCFIYDLAMRDEKLPRKPLSH
jgi:hypothetical protein